MHSYLHGHPSLTQAVRKLEQLAPDQFELYFSRKSSTKIEAKNQKIDALTRSEDVGLAIRLLKDRRLGFSFTTSLEKSAIEQAVENAAAVAAAMPEDEHAALHSFSTSVYQDVDLLDSKSLALPVDGKIDLALQLEAECRKADRRVTGVRSAAVGETSYEVHMVDSHGEHLNYQGSLYSASIACKAEQDGDSQMGGDFGFSNFLDQLDIKSVALSGARYATEILGAGAAPTMQCPAILRNDVVTELLGFLSSSFSAEEIDKGRSMLAGKEGTRVFSEHMALVNDGLLPGGLMSAPFDGEGVPTKKIALIEGGFFSATLCDLYYARKMGKQPSGCASRGIKAPPSIGTSNLYMPNGKKTFEQLTSGITRGILITDLMGVHTANAVTGDFSLGASGILIENGKLTRPVRGFAVAGNVLELFRKISDIGNDMRFFGSVGAPSVRVTDISIGGS